MRKILCVCSANTARSPLMQTLLAEMLGPGFEVESAGTYDALKDLPIGHGIPPDETIVAFAKQQGFDIRNNKSRHVSQCDLSQYELIVCVDVLVRLEVLDWLKSSVPVIVANEQEGGILDPPRTLSPLDEPVRLRCLAQIQRSMRKIADELLHKNT